MLGPWLVDELYFDEDVTASEMNCDGTLFIVAVPSMLGLYRVISGLGRKSVVHIGSYFLENGGIVEQAFFSEDSSVVTIILSNGKRKELSVSLRENGFMKELTPKVIRVAA